MNDGITKCRGDISTREGQAKKSPKKPIEKYERNNMNDIEEELNPRRGRFMERGRTGYHRLYSSENFYMISFALFGRMPPGTAYSAPHSLSSFPLLLHADGNLDGAGDKGMSDVFSGLNRGG
jgi:hypothetical protein